LGRSNADLNAIKACYQQMFGRDMVKEIRDDLSMKTASLYLHVLSATRQEESAPCVPRDIDESVDRIQRATDGPGFSGKQDEVYRVIASASDGQLRAINARYQEKYRKPLQEVLRDKFNGHMQEALLLMLARAVDRVKADADGLEQSMKGMGTKDELLVNRLVRCHWNREHLRQVNVAYRRFYNKALIDRVKGETSGDYRNLMMAICQ
jgi:annexin A7/11